MPPVPCAGQHASGRETLGSYLAFPQQVIPSGATGLQIYLTHASDVNTGGVYQATVSTVDTLGAVTTLISAPPLNAGTGQIRIFASLPPGAVQFLVNAVWTDDLISLGIPNTLDVGLNWYCGGDDPGLSNLPGASVSPCTALSTVVYQNLSGTLVAGATGYGITVTVDPQIWAQRPDSTGLFIFQPFEFMWLESATHDPVLLYDTLEIQYQTPATGGAWPNWQTLRIYEGGRGYLLGASQGGDAPDTLAPTISFRLHNYGASGADFTNLTLYFLCHGLVSSTLVTKRGRSFAQIIGG